jgi:hypothetical protein
MQSFAHYVTQFGNKTREYLCVQHGIAYASNDILFINCSQKLVHFNSGLSIDRILKLVWLSRKESRVRVAYGTSF